MNPIPEIRVNVTGSAGCTANISQFTFSTTGSTGYSQNRTTNISQAALYFSDTASGFSYAQCFGFVNNPNGSFTINGSQQLFRGQGTYYFYLAYRIPTSANIGDGVDASMTSFVFNGTTITNMSTPNPSGYRTIVSGNCASSVDMPSPTQHLQTATVNSLVIPMDNAHQNIGAPFNLKAYGLVNALLQNDIPVRWVIRTGKAKDGIDFSVNASRVYPTTVAAAYLDFRASEFIIDTFWVNHSFYPGGQTATQVITSFGNNVAV